MTYQPKGGMCMTCLRGLTRNCANLPFDTMPVIEVDKATGAKIVRCLDHEPLPKREKDDAGQATKAP